jgi:hypothetical protein
LLPVLLLLVGLLGLSLLLWGPASTDEVSIMQEVANALFETKAVLVAIAQGS